MAHIEMIEATYNSIRDDEDFANIIKNALMKALYRFHKENEWQIHPKTIDYASVNIVCGYCGQRNTLCIEIKADDEKLFQKIDEGEGKPELQLPNVFENLLIAIMKNSSKENKPKVLQAYIQRYGPLSEEAGDIVRKLLEDGGQE